MKRILIISGKQKAGKTTTSNEVMKVLSERKTMHGIFKFAKPIYDIQEAAKPVLVEYGLWPEGADKDGEFLQVIGTEYGRNRRGNDVWVNILRKRIDQFLAEDSHRVAIIDDCRFENEFDAFPDAFKVRIECPRDIRKSRPGFWRDDEHHPSEVGLDSYAEQKKFDFKISSEDATPEEITSVLFICWDGSML